MKKLMFCILFLLTVLFPSSAFAVDFSIPKVTIDAHLAEDGHVEVIEQHTYDFEGKFNGLIRELIPKKGTSIEDFKAYENEVALPVERDGGEYRIHRKGKRETVKVEFHYTIRDAMEKYKDGAQFYWPFFDHRNETAYGNMTIHIHPPAPAKDVLYLGYDAAYKKALLKDDGVVSFEMGRVPSKKNGDIRVVYEPALFPSIKEQKGMIREEIAAEEKREAEAIAARASRKKNAKNFGSYGLPVILIGIIGFFGLIFKRRNAGKREALYKLRNEKTLVPEATMSMPAIIYYTNGSSTSPELMAAALLDLVRKGNVKQLADDEFEIIHRNVGHDHESALIEFLFDKVGNGTHFKLDDLKEYAKDEKNHIQYNIGVGMWRKGIKEEVDQAQLVGKTKSVRIPLILASITLAISAMFFGGSGLVLLVVIALLFSVTTMTFAIFYKPRNEKGHLLYEEWARFRNVFRDSDIDEWRNLPTDDKFKAFTYSVGSRDKGFTEQFQQFIDAEKRVTPRDSSPAYMYYNPVLMNSTFTSASTNASPSSSGGSSGGGTGGGGGGSGAF